MICKHYLAYHTGSMDETSWQAHLLICDTCQKAAAEDAVIEDQLRHAAIPLAGEDLWDSIESALENEAGRPRMKLFHSDIWKWAGRIAAVLIVGLGLGYGLGVRDTINVGGTLSSGAISRLENRENTFVYSISELTGRARVHSASLTLDDRLRYRDYLENLDVQIANVREALRTNPGNRHLRKDLLDVLEEKKMILEEMLQYRSPQIAEMKDAVNI
ncbi:hypothetical protein KAR48_10615 [bacterium]|nr:hypothetical protein [bacterium]